MPHSPLIRVFLVMAAISGSVQAQFSQGPDATNIPKGGAQVELDMSRPIPIIHASINGEGPFPFFLDSGATGIVLNEAFAQELKLEIIGTQQVVDMARGAAIDSDLVSLEQVEIGGAIFTGLSALSSNRTGIHGSAGGAPRGIIGLSTFANCLFTIDYPGGEMLIEDGQLPQADGRSILDYESDADSTMPVFTVDVEGTQYPAHIDSGGSSGITLPYNQIDSLPLEGKPIVVGQARSASGSFEVYGSKLNGTITLGAYSWESPQVMFVPTIQWVHFGTEALKRFTITWDQQNRRVRFVDPTGATVDRSQAQRPKRYGIQFNPNQIGSGELVVDGVIEGMAAQTSGLRAGDQILTINGKSVSGASQLELATIFKSSPLNMTVKRDDKIVNITMALD